MHFWIFCTVNKKFCKIAHFAKIQVLYVLYGSKFEKEVLTEGCMCDRIQLAKRVIRHGGLHGVDATCDRSCHDTAGLNLSAR